MSVCEIYIPESLDLINTISFTDHLNDLPEVDEYIFNFKDMDWVEPFSLLLLSSEIQRCRNKFQSKKFSAINHKDKSYAGHMGFFKAFGCEFGKNLGKPPVALAIFQYPFLVLKNLEVMQQKSMKTLVNSLTTKRLRFPKY
jgi:hypothetical protein